MPSPSLNEALALMNQQAFSSAAAICRQHLADRPDDFNARHLLGLIQFKAGQLLGATKDLQKASRLPVAARFKAQAMSNLALVLQARGRMEDAGEALSQAVKLQPDELAFHLNLLGLLERQREWTQIADHLTDFPALKQHPDAVLSLAVALRHHQQYDQAASLLAPFLDSAEIQNEWALNQCLHAHTHSVIQFGLRSANPAAWLTTAADYMAEEGHPEAATPIYKAAFELEPGNESIRHMLDAASGTCTTQAPNTYVRELYDQHADAFEDRLTGQLEYQAPTLLTERLQTLIPKGADKLIDLGCGTGLCGEALQEKFKPAQLIGCDLSERMLAHAASKSVYTQLLHTDLLSALKTQSDADLITATDVLIYTGALSPVLNSAIKALKPGGYFAFTVETCTHSNGVQLGASGRFRHDPSQIQIDAEALGYQVSLLERFPLRREHGEMLEGALIILRRAE